MQMQNLFQKFRVDNADYIYIFFGIIKPSCGIFENGVLLMCTLEGVSSVANLITAYEESQLNQDSNFLSTNWSLFPKAIF